MTDEPATGQLAHAEFEFSLDDLVDVSMRHLRTDDTHRRLRRQGSISVAAIGGISMLVLLSLLASQGSLLAGAISVVTALAAGALHYVRLDGILARRLRRHLAGMYGAGPHHCRVELHHDRMVTEQFGGTRDFPWPQVTGMTLDGDDIEVRARPSWTMVRGRAFANATERDAFLATAQRLWRAAQPASAPVAVS